MVETQPIVCSVLKLPPDQVPFFRLKDVLDDMLRKVDHLNLVLASTEHEDAAHLLRGTRTEMAEHATTILHAVGYASDFSGQILELIDAVAENPTDQLTGETIAYNSHWAGSTAKLFEAGDKGVTGLISDMTTVAERIASLLGDGKPDAKTSENVAFSAENKQVIADLLAAAREIVSILRQIGGYYRDMQSHLAELKESIATTQPSNSESDMVRQRWAAFATALEDLPTAIGRIQQKLEESPPTVYRADDPMSEVVADRIRSRNAPKRTSPTLEVRLLEAPPPEQSASAGPPPTSPWQATLGFFRRLFACFLPRRTS